MKVFALLCVASGVATANATYFQQGDAAHCHVDAAGRTVVHYDSKVHASFKCTHSGSTCSCTSTHPQHHAGGCMEFDHTSGTTHKISGECENQCVGVTCQNGGTCNDGVNSYTCSCPAGFTGTHCETNIDDCATNPCQNGGSCSDGVNSYTCSCAAGFAGANCETNIDDCATNPCQNGGSCSDGVNSYTCSCAAGFTGVNCQTNINDCAGVTCQNGGTCNDKVNGYSCTCASGFAGTHCETNINDCAGVTCQNGGTCKDQVNGYSCTCAPGFSGTHCETPQFGSAVTVCPAHWARTYSSVWTNQGAGATCNKPHVGTDTSYGAAWCAGSSSVGQWMQMDAGSVKGIYGIVMQKRGDANGSQHVTSVKFKVSSDGSNWSDVDGGKTFAGSSASHSVHYMHTVHFSGVVMARYVRVYPQSFTNYMSMRACLSVGQPAGVTKVVVNPPQSARSFSSVWTNQGKGATCNKSLLGTDASYGAAWCAGTSSVGQWMQMDLGSVKTVAGIVTQRRGDSNGSQYVSSVKVKVSSNGSVWSDVDGGNTFSNQFVHDSAHYQRHTLFNAAATARYVRIYPQSFTNYMSMRAGVIIYQ